MFLQNLPLVATNFFLLFLDYAVVKGDASVSEIKFSIRTKISALVSFENRKAGRPTVDPESGRYLDGNHCHNFTND